MLIDRRNQVINVCEEKFSVAPYVITNKYIDEMLVRMENFREATRIRSALHLTMIVASGLAWNEYSDVVQSVVTLDSIFEK